MTKGKTVLDLLKYVKTATKNFDLSEASIVVMWPSDRVTWPYMALQALHGLTWPYMALHGLTWPYTALHGLTRPYTAIHGLTWPNMALHGLNMALHGLRAKNKIENASWAITFSPFWTYRLSHKSVLTLFLLFSHVLGQVQRNFW